MSNDIEELALKCGAIIEQFTGNDNKKHDQICFDCDAGELEAFVAALSQPQEAVGYMSEASLQNLRNGNDVIVGKKAEVRTVEVYTTPPNYEALIEAIRNRLPNELVPKNNSVSALLSAVAQLKTERNNAMFDNEQLLNILRFWRDECSGYEPSISVFERMVDEALKKGE